MKTRYAVSNSHMFGMMESLSRIGASAGTGFLLLMEHPGKNKPHPECNDYSLWPRFGQPCQGGDMRRYGENSSDATQPHNSRPTDLTQPFPEGKPSALAFHNIKFNTDGSITKFFEALVSDDSPWRSGFGGRNNVQTYSNEAGHPIGYIIKNLDVDPTVLVNGVNFINTISGNARNFDLLVSEGLTANEALAVLMLNGVGQVNSLAATYDYRHPPVFSARRFFEKRPNDLSGGLYSAGCDYNRTYVQDVFLGSKEKGGIVWITEASKHMGSAQVSAKTLAEVAKKVFEEALANEPELTPEDTQYVYRNAEGEVLPYPKAALKANPNLKIEKKEAA